MVTLFWYFFFVLSNFFLNKYLTIRKKSGYKIFQRIRFDLLVNSILLIFITIGIFKPLSPELWRKDSQKSDFSEIIFIVKNTKKDDTVLIWGAETVYHFLSDRNSPTRFPYQYPLLLDGYDNQNKIKEFITGIKEKRPKIIIDTAYTNLAVPPIDSKERDSYKPPDGYSVQPELATFFEYVSDNYQKVGRFEDKNWVIYQLIENN